MKKIKFTLEMTVTEELFNEESFKKGIEDMANPEKVKEEFVDSEEGVIDAIATIKVVNA